jgi:hypothetical protein
MNPCDLSWAEQARLIAPALGAVLTAWFVVGCAGVALLLMYLEHRQIRERVEDEEQPDSVF